MANNIAKTFSLPGLHVHIIKTTDTAITLKAKSPRRTAECTKCGNRSNRLHQYHRRTVNHGYLHDKLILVQLTVRRFKCRPCGKPFTEILPGISRRLSTNHCLNRRLQDAALLSLRAVAERNGVAPASVLNQLSDVRYEIDWSKQGKRISLGIDEHSLRKRRQMVTTVTNLTRGQRNILTILPNDRKDTIIKFLNQVPQEARERITEICIDMRSSFRSAIEEAMSDVNIVADPFHVVQLTSRVIDDIRPAVLGNLGKPLRVVNLLRTPSEKLTDEDKEKLTELWAMTRPWPSLRVAWQTREKVRDLYHSRNRASAAKKFALILAYLDGVESAYLTTLRKTLISWQSYILNHFDHGTSNGFTEGCHTKIKMLKRVSFGFINRERYRTKILLAFRPLSEFSGSTLS